MSDRIRVVVPKVLTEWVVSCILGHMRNTQTTATTDTYIALYSRYTDYLIRHIDNNDLTPSEFKEMLTDAKALGRNFEQDLAVTQ